jgi:hypothetical protein
LEDRKSFPLLVEKPLASSLVKNNVEIEADILYSSTIILYIYFLSIYGLLILKKSNIINFEKLSVQPIIKTFNSSI